MTTSPGTISAYSDLDDLSEAAARYVATAARRTIAQRGRFILALAGGSTPRRLYRLLASPAWRDRVDWDRWHFFLGDERVVPPRDARSNFGTVERSLLARVPVAPAQIHRAPTEVGDADA